MINDKMLNDQNFTTTLTVNKTPEEVFTAINNVRGWWLDGRIEGNTDKLGEEWIYSYKDKHYSKQRTIELVPGKKIVWLVFDSYLSFIKNKIEWNNTKIIFEIFKKDNKTEIRFTHVGLIPACECFERCSEAWTFYIKNSLQSLITSGVGQSY